MSVALEIWQTTRQVALNEIAQAHARVGGSTRGRRYATQQINQAYAVLLSSQFQGFCRDLHTECVEHLVTYSQPVSFQTRLTVLLTRGRMLDRGNPNPSNLGADFGRLGIDFWPTVAALDRRNARRQASLQELNDWRNAISHQDFDSAKLGGRTTLRLDDVRRWRSSCSALAIQLDRAMHDHLIALTGAAPW